MKKFLAVIALVGVTAASAQGTMTMGEMEHMIRDLQMRQSRQEQIQRHPLEVEIENRMRERGDFVPPQTIDMNNSRSMARRMHQRGGECVGLGVLFERHTLYFGAGSKPSRQIINEAVMKGCL